MSIDQRFESLEPTAFNAATLLKDESLQADDVDNSSTTPTGWWWLTGVSEATINQKVQEGFRMIHLEVESTSPYRFTAAFVKNEGIYHKVWWWYYGKTSDEVKDLIGKHKARITNLNINFVNGEKRYAIVLVSNTGSEAKTWWYYSQLSFEDLEDKLKDNNAHLTDLGTYVVDNKRFFSAVMISNQGEDRKTWWYYSGITVAEIRQKLEQNGARLTVFTLRSQSSSGNTYAVVMEKLQGESWWWYYGQTEDQVNALTAQNGARIIRIEPYREGNQKRFNVIMLNNSNALTTQMRRYLDRNRQGGTYGLYLKQVRGSVLASLQSTKAFYPASTIKVLEHVHTMLQVDNGSENLTTSITKYPASADSCSNSHAGQDSVTETLAQALRNMMEQSDNQSTNALQEYFGSGNAAVGRAEMNATIHNVLNLSNNTALNHKFGCGGPSNDPANSLTLSDLGKTYEAVATGLFDNNSTRETFYDLMLTSLGSIATVIDQEAAQIGLTTTQVEEFKSQVRTAAKAGSFSTGSGDKYLSIGGWVQLPFKRNSTITTQEYVFGLFIDQADSIDEDFSIWDARAELLRNEIRSALATFD